jgi:multicomponent Na+:H+ antiporter subunit F
MNLSDVAIHIVLPLLGVALVLTFIRLMRGPTLPDRAAALDLMSALGIGFVAAYAVATDQSAVLDTAVVLALVSFLGTVGFALYVERRV